MLSVKLSDLHADMAELVDATDLKSVGTCSRAGSIPAFRTNNKSLHKFCVDSFFLFSMA